MTVSVCVFISLFIIRVSDVRGKDKWIKDKEGRKVEDRRPKGKGETGRWING
jgi:hypothetical protein